MDLKNHIIKNPKFWVIIIIVFVTFSIYAQVLNHDFVNFDDDGYVYKNTLVNTGLSIEGIYIAFSTIHKVNWIPLTLVSHMIDVQIFGLSPGGHHFTNLFFHILNSLLLFFFLNINTRKMWLSFIVAMLFAVHPLHVESVAWISERKDVLSTFFGLWALILYSYFVRQQKLKYYFLTLLFFLCSLLSKPMLVTLPVIFFLIDFWPLKRVSSSLDFLNLKKNRFLIIEKIPFFILSLIFCIITILSQKTGITTSVSLTKIPIFTRLMNALVAYSGYIYKAIWPFELSVIYPYRLYIEPIHAMMSFLFLFFISIYIIVFHKKYPFLFVGWLWFLITLLPVIGLIQVGSQSMADRYTYIPLVGLFIVAVWSLDQLIKKFKINRNIAITGTVVLIISFSLITMNQLTTWQNSFTLFKHALSVTQNNWVAHTNFAAELAERGQLDDSIYHYQQAIKINKNIPAAWFNLGNAYSSKKMFDKAHLHYLTALELKPDYANAYIGIGAIMGRKGDYRMAIKAYEKALEIDPYLKNAIRNKNYAEKLLESEQQ